MPTYSCETSPLNNLRDLILSSDDNLAIEVIYEDEDVELDKEEIVYYGDDHGAPLIFQTLGYLGQPKILIEEAIRWYAFKYLDYPEMYLTTKMK